MLVEDLAAGYGFSHALAHELADSLQPLVRCGLARLQGAGERFY